jgi:hypothetical protein
VPAGREEVLAPIEGVEVTSNGGSATAAIKSGLPSGCAQYSRAAVSRQGDLVQVEVYNTMPTGNVACTMIYGITEHSVALGDGFVPGTTYTLQVNDRTQTFIAR